MMLLSSAFPRANFWGTFRRVDSGMVSAASALGRSQMVFGGSSQHDRDGSKIEKPQASDCALFVTFFSTESQNR